MNKTAIQTILENQILILKLLKIQNDNIIDELSNNSINTNLIASKEECEIAYRTDLTNEISKAISNSIAQIGKENTYD